MSVKYVKISIIMVDFINIRRGRNVLSSVLHVILNLALAVASTALTVISGSWLLGVMLVLLSKWRVVAVRPRYWWLNFKSSLVDLIVGISLVMLVYDAGTELNLAHIIITLIYAIWLIFIKPKSSSAMTEAQSLLAIFFGTYASILTLDKFDPIFIVIASFIIGYGASRHLLIQGEDHDFSITTFTFGLLMAEFSWIFYHWLIVYNLDFLSLKIPQLAIFQALFSFVYFHCYKSALRHDGKIKPRDIMAPTIFSVLIMVLMLIFFSEPRFNI